MLKKKNTQNTNYVATFRKQVDSGLQHMKKQSVQQINAHAEASNKIQSELKSNTSDWSNQISDQQKAVNSHKNEQSKQQQQFQQQLQHFIDTLKVDKATGTTPIKAPITVPASFVRTEEHSQLLDDRRKMLALAVNAHENTDENAHENTNGNTDENTDENTHVVSDVEQLADGVTQESSMKVNKLSMPTLTKLSTPVAKKSSSLSESQIPVLSSTNRLDYKQSEKKRKKTAHIGHKNLYNKSSKGRKIHAHKSKISGRTHIPSSRTKRMKNESSNAIHIRGIEKFPR